MSSADFNNVTLRNIAPANADGSFVHPGYVFTIGPDSKQYWTNSLYLDRIVVSTILINSTLELVAGKFITIGVSSGTISTLTTTFINADSTITTSTINAGNITYSTLTGIVGTTTILTASTTNTTNIGFSTGSGLYLITNGLTVNTSIITSTLNGIHLTYSTLSGSTITTSTMTASTIGFSTTTGSTLTVNLLNATSANMNSGLYSTLTGSSIVTSTLSVSSIYYSTLVGSTIQTSTLTAYTIGFSTTVGSTLTITQLNQNIGLFSTLTGSSLVTSTLSVSSLFYSSLYGSSIVTSTLFGSTIGFSTMTGSTLTTAIANVTSANVNSGLYSTMTGSSLVTSTLSVSSLYYSTAQGSTLVISTATVSTLGFSTMTGSTLTTSLLTATSANVNSGLYSSLLGSTITTSTLVASTLGFSTVFGSSLTAANAVVQSTLLVSTANTVNVTYSMLVGSTVAMNTGVWNSTLIGSTMNAMNVTYSTLIGSTFVINTGVCNSTLIGSTMNAVNVTYSTLQGSTITSNTMSIGVLTIGSTLTASSITTTSLGYSTINGSTITASTINIASLLTISSGNVGIGTTNPTYALQTSTLNTVNLSGNYIEDWTTVFSNSDSTAFTCTFNGTPGVIVGPPQEITVTLGGSTNAIITFNNNIIPGNVYQLTINARMSGSSPYFILCDHIANDAQIAGTTQQTLSGTYKTFVLTFTAPSGSFSLSCISQSSTVFYYNGVQLRAFFNQMIGGLGIGTTNPSFSLHVPKGSIQGYNLQRHEWINTQSNNRGTGLYKVATLGTTGSGYGMINVRGQIGGRLNTNTMYVDVSIISNNSLTVWGTVYGNQSSAALQCDIVYNLNTSSQFDIYIYVKAATLFVYDLMVSGASGSNVLYDPATTAMTVAGSLALVSVSALANVYAVGGNGGNVGIGKTNPGYTLDVNGTLNASQILQNGAPLSTGGGGGSSQWITSGSNIYYLLGNVGISTNNPTTPLHIYGSGERIRLDGSSAAQTYIMFSTQGTNRGYIGTGASGVDMVINAYASQNLIFQAGAAERMRILDTGYVGIGTNAPGANLHINDISAIGSTVPFMVFSPNLPANREQFLYFGTANSTNNTAQIGWYNVAAGSALNYAFLQIYGKANIMTWQASTGNVGIGVTNPVKLFQVAGNGLFGYVAGSRGGIFLDSEAAYTGSPCIQGVTSSFGTNTVTINPAGGNVGINTTVSSYPLHVAGNINLTGSILYNGVAITTGAGSIWTAGGGGVAYYNGGSIGVGTANPVSLLHVNGGNMTVNYGNMVCFHSTYPAGGSYSIGGAGANLRIALNSDAATHRLLDIGYYTGDVPTGTWNSRMVVDPINGNVGIGTLSPVYPISVATTGGTGLEVNRTGSTVNYGIGTIYSLTSATGSFRGEYAWTIGGATTIATSAQTQANGYYAIDLATAGVFSSTSSYTNSYLFLTTTAACFPKTNVGIGTAAPSYSLTIFGSATTASANSIIWLDNTLSGGVTTTGGQIGSLQFSNNGVTAAGIFCVLDDGGVNNNGALAFYTRTDYNSTYLERMRITRNGNVGIGTTAPSTNLHLWSQTTQNVSPVLTLTGYSTTQGSGPRMDFYCWTSAVTPQARIEAYDDNNYGSWMVLSTKLDGGGSNALRESLRLGGPNGYVGIGTDSPSALLHVNGTAYRNGTTTWDSTSDERLKENIVLADVDRCVEIVRSVPLKHYRWKDEAFTEDQIKDRSKLGWIAQDVEKVFPKAVSTRRFAYNQVYENVVADDGSTEKKLVSEDVIEDCRMFNADQIYAVMYGAIQKLIAANDELVARIEALESKS